MPSEQRDWTQGPAKWAAAVVLGTASTLGMTWSIVGRTPAPTWNPGHAAAPSVAAERTKIQTADVGASAAPKLEGRVNVNTATQAELEMLPGIGAALAKRIIDYRTQQGPFRSVNDLDKVNGIGPRTVERLRPLVSVE